MISVHFDTNNNNTLILRMVSFIWARVGSVASASCQNSCDYHKLILMGLPNDIMRKFKLHLDGQCWSLDDHPPTMSNGS